MANAHPSMLENIYKVKLASEIICIFYEKASPLLYKGKSEDALQYAMGSPLYSDTVFTKLGYKLYIHF